MSHRGACLARAKTLWVVMCRAFGGRSFPVAVRGYGVGFVVAVGIREASMGLALALLAILEPSAVKLYLPCVALVPAGDTVSARMLSNPRDASPTHAMRART